MIPHLIAIRDFATDYFNLDPDRVTQLVGAGSDREYFRLLFVGRPVIGTWSENVRENEAFFYLSSRLHEAGVNVPVVLAIDEGRTLYLQEDCGSYDALSLLADLKFDSQRPLLSRIVKELADIHLKASPGIDYLRCYPSPVFGFNDVLFDLHYFERYFLLRVDLAYDHSALRRDFEQIALQVLNCHFVGFMYRDFQTRNILVRDDEIFFIDFQGGRRGPCIYDLISLIYQAKLGLDDSSRRELFDIYAGQIVENSEFSNDDLLRDLSVMLPVRLLQVLGAYGRRGLVEKKAHFIGSISPAIDNLNNLTAMDGFQAEFPELNRILKQIIQDKSRILCQIQD